VSKRGENIYKRKDGRWEGRYIKERSADGKARYAYVYGKSYADAKQKLLDRRITQAQNIDCSPSHTKYGDILRNWIAMSRIFNAILVRMGAALWLIHWNLQTAILLPWQSPK